MTAWHNCTGLDFITKEHISAEFWCPDRFHITLTLESPDGNAIGHVEFRSRLYLDEAELEPIWMMDPQQGSRLDIAAIPLRKFADDGLIESQSDRDLVLELVEKLDPNDAYADLSFADVPQRLCAYGHSRLENPIQVAQDVFVIGFPEGISGGSGTPIWKRGTAASEPSLPVNDRQCFVIDSATRPGLSGSPVVARYESPATHVPPTDSSQGGMLIGHQSEVEFAGLYTARLPNPVRLAEMLDDRDMRQRLISSPEQWSRAFLDTIGRAQLGIVWPREAIETVLSKGVIGKPASDHLAIFKEGKGDSKV